MVDPCWYAWYNIWMGWIAYPKAEPMPGNIKGLVVRNLVLGRVNFTINQAVVCRHIQVPGDIFEVKLTFEMLTVRGQQHSFSTRERVFLGKCQSFWDRKRLDLRGTQTPNLRIHAECSNLLRYQGQTFAVPCCWILALVVYIFLK